MRKGRSRQSNKIQKIFADFPSPTLSWEGRNGKKHLKQRAIAAVVVGGTSLSGGKGSVVNTLLGVLIIAVLQTGLAQIGATEPTKRVITGLVIIAAVILDVYRNRSDGVGSYFKGLLRS